MCAWLYLESVGSSSEDGPLRLSGSQIRLGLGTLVLTFLLSFGLFLVKIDRKYVVTFFTWQTGHGRAKQYFLHGSNDLTKSVVLQCQQRQWASIRPKVAEWLDANWERWERDKPPWFNAVFIHSVDDDIMPKWARKRDGRARKQEEESSESDEVDR